ncbi:hypothetical protein NUW54_g2981 [Trametes sanguinea]|uniref:Uncharacterized protein n=1 Tax=Trametes sanguinea TaxID=158606 RepID=A0ACC1Q3Y6_9APHY|nr:hypothetical protein NUW54_g2981 [Trametes sanguinea]
MVQYIPARADGDRGLPPPFEEFLRYCRKLQFTDRPDYERWIDEFRELAEENGFPGDPAFIWPPPNPEVGRV